MALLTYLHFFFFNDTATTEIYTLSLHDALPIFGPRCTAAVGTTTTCFIVSISRRTLMNCPGHSCSSALGNSALRRIVPVVWSDRKSTRLNSSHGYISYAVFCLTNYNRVSASIRP